MQHEFDLLGSRALSGARAIAYVLDDIAVILGVELHAHFDFRLGFLWWFRLAVLHGEQDLAEMRNPCQSPIVQYRPFDFLSVSAYPLAPRGKIRGAGRVGEADTFVCSPALTCVGRSGDGA